jgi:hypothetical protein
MQAELTPPQDIAVPAPETAPVAVIKADDLKALGNRLAPLFTQYVSDRRVAELKWMRNLRQYLGQYDPDVERELSVNRSKAYPRITRVKCISVLSRVMNLMFPGNERNWELQASPSPDMDPAEVMQSLQTLMQAKQAAGDESPLTDDDVDDAVMELAQKRAEKLSTQIDDQLQELGGDQSLDYIALNRKVVQSGIMYGLGVMRGPFVTATQKTKWGIDVTTGMPQPRAITQYKPMFEFLPVWDFYPDMSAKTLRSGDGYFIRLVMSRHQVRKLADRQDFFGEIIKTYLKTTGQQGNYKAQPFEAELRTMGVKINVNEQKAETTKYEVIVWNGPVSGQYLQMAGVDVPEDRLADDLEAEVWMIDNNVIKADINPWRKLGTDVQTIHTFLFDEDDTSPIGNGLPNVMRDSQMSVCAAARMLLDNASVVCGPNLELNTELLRLDQDLTSVHAYKIWYREGLGLDAQQQAVRNVQIDSHMDELLKTIDLFMKFADMETFVGPATGGDMEKGPSEPMRTAAGASMIRGDAALPFKDIIRNFDSFTQSYITSLVWFNRKFNPNPEFAGDYNVIARGATSLIAKEVRGMQLDQLAATMTPEEKMHVDERKMVEQRFAVRDLSGMLVSPAEAKRRSEAAAANAQKQTQQQEEMVAAEVRKTLAEAFKSVAQGQKNAASAEATQVKATLDILEKGLTSGPQAGDGAGTGGAAADPQQSRRTAGSATA